jgi:hypothetical protein
MNDDESAPESAELFALLDQLRSRLDAWNQKYGHPFAGIQDGHPTAIRPELMPACRAFAGREELIAALPKDKRFAEVGNWFGNFAVQILALNQPREFHTFDWNLHLMKPENRRILDEYGRVFYHDGDPAVTVQDIPAGSFDIVYLNKAKDFSGVRQDLEVWFETLAPQGTLIVNDFTAWDPVQGFAYGVLPAVSRFVNERHVEVVAISLQARGFLNIALCK